MTKILLIYPPFCTPASPPYSITNLYAYLKENTTDEIGALDLNLEYHKLKFSEYQKYYKKIDLKNYEETTKKFRLKTKEVYSKNNLKVIGDQKPEYFDSLFKKIKDYNPEIIAFSVVYSSQAFYTYSLLKKLKSYKTIVGGPAVNKKLIENSTKYFCNEKDFLKYLNYEEKQSNPVLDFSIYPLREYFTEEIVIPVKTSNTCYYQKCAYCSHFSNIEYKEYSLDWFKKNVINSKQKYFFLIDEMITTKRLLEISKILKPLKVYWTCQLKPIKTLTYDVLKELKESGLVQIMWGVESGNDRILKLMKKGTTKKDVGQVLKNSHEAGIKNITYIMYGFPTETKEELIETINFLQNNDEYIDLISGSVFGLQHNSEVYKNPKKYSILKINEEQRTILEPKISFELEKGLTNKEVKKIISSYSKTLNKINKFPKTMNFFREHMLIKIEKKND